MHSSVVSGSARYKDTAPVWPDLSPVLLISVKLKFWDTERESIERGFHCALYLLLETLNSDRFQLSAQWPWLSKVSTSKNSGSFSLRDPEDLVHDHSTALRAAASLEEVF